MWLCNSLPRSVSPFAFWRVLGCICWREIYVEVNHISCSMAGWIFLEEQLAPRDQNFLKLRSLLWTFFWKFLCSFDFGCFNPLVLPELLSCVTKLHSDWLPLRCLACSNSKYLVGFAILTRSPLFVHLLLVDMLILLDSITDIVFQMLFQMVEPFTAHYVFALGVARFLGCAHWILRVSYFLLIWQTITSFVGGTFFTGLAFYVSYWERNDMMITQFTIQVTV